MLDAVLHGVVKAALAPLGGAVKTRAQACGIDVVVYRFSWICCDVDELVMFSRSCAGHKSMQHVAGSLDSVIGGRAGAEGRAWGRYGGLTHPCVLTAFCQS